jgi:cyanophycinase
MPAMQENNKQRGYIIPIGGAEGKKAKRPSILNRFVDLCGGSDARIMVIPTASLLNETGPQYKALFKEMGAESMCVPIEERDECFNEETLRILDGATGIFITGGNQLRLSTILGGTPVARRMRKLNAKGVHVAGTSAGAAIVSEHMIAGGRSGSSPRESGVELAPGLGLTNRVIIDQHFNQRQRMGRLLAALSFNPFACGLGIDENTAGFIAPDGRMEVVGKGTVTVVDPANLRHSSMSYVRRAEAVTLIGLKLHVLAEGAQFNLETREATLD